MLTVNASLDVTKTSAGLSALRTVFQQAGRFTSSVEDCKSQTLASVAQVYAREGKGFLWIGFDREGQYCETRLGLEAHNGEYRVFVREGGPAKYVEGPLNAELISRIESVVSGLYLQK